MVIQSFEKHSLSKRMGKLPHGSRMWKWNKSLVRHTRPYLDHLDLHFATIEVVRKTGKWINSILQKSSQLFLNWKNPVYHVPILLDDKRLTHLWHALQQHHLLHAQRRGWSTAAAAPATQVPRNGNKHGRRGGSLATWQKLWQHMSKTVCVFLMMIQVLWMINISHFLSFHPRISIFFGRCWDSFKKKWPNWAAWLLSPLGSSYKLNFLCCSHRWTMHLLGQAGPFPGDVGGQSAAGKWSNEIRLD